MKPRLSLGNIVRITPKSIRDRGMRECVMRINTVRVDMDQDGVCKIVQARTICGNKHHQTTIKFYHGNIPTDWNEAKEALSKVPTGADLWKAPVWVSCNCEYFLYHCEVALATYRCSSVMHSSGEAPLMTNPARTPYACKHIIALAPRAINASKEVSRDELDSQTYPMRPGRPPRALVDMARKKKLTPTETEVMDSVPKVKDFI